MDKQLTIQDLHKQLAAQEAELRRASTELARMREELARAKDELARALVERRQTEQALQESEEQFRLIVEHSHDVVYAVAPDGIVSYVSPHFRHYGYSPEEIISKHFLEFVAPEQRERVIESFVSGTKAGTNDPTAFQWLKKDGSRVWVEVIGNTIFDDSGKPAQQVGVMRDITKRRRQYETTRSLELLLETLDAECFIKDQDGIHQYVNSAFERQFVVKREDLIGQDDAFVFGEENAQLLRENDRRIMASRETESIEESGYLPGGNYAVYVTIKTPIIDENDNVTGICGVGIDITHQKQLEEELRESERKFRHLVERISDVVYAMDTRGVLTYVSPAVKPFLGYGPEEMVGRPFSDFMAPEDLPRSQRSFQRLIGGASTDPNEYRMRNKIGGIRWIRASSQPIVEEDEVVGIQGVLTDITDRMRSEEQQRLAAAAAERERLARDLHDSVTQTLSSIAAIAEVLPDIWDRDPDRARHGLGDLQQQTQSALAEMRSLLVSSRPGALLERDLASLIHELIDAMAARTRMPITATVVGECRPPDDIKLALYRVAQEALNNVVKHAEASRAIVRLECTGEQVTLSVSDNGHGFDPDGVKPDQLGLGIMRERAEAADVALVVDSEPGYGTTVTATWNDTSQTAENGL